jgi:glutamine synthetase
VKEAKKRGLSNLKKTPEALAAYLTKDVVELFEKEGVLTHEELEARTEIYLEKYQLKIQIESRVAGDVAMNHIIPAALNYQKRILDTSTGITTNYDAKTAKVLSKPHLDIAAQISEHVNNLQKNVYDMIEERKVANNMDDIIQSSRHYCDMVFPYLELIRKDCDKLELLVDDELWPLPKYRELLFTR